MKRQDFDKARELSDKIDSIKTQIREIDAAFEKQYDTKCEKGIKRMFLRFCTLQRHLLEDRCVTYVFSPEKLHGVEIDLDQEFVLYILDFLKKRLDKFEEEFSEI